MFKNWPKTEKNNFFNYDFLPKQFICFLYCIKLSFKIFKNLIPCCPLYKIFLKIKFGKLSFFPHFWGYNSTKSTKKGHKKQTISSDVLHNRMRAHSRKHEVLEFRVGLFSHIMPCFFLEIVYHILTISSPVFVQFL